MNNNNNQQNVSFFQTSNQILKLPTISLKKRSGYQYLFDEKKQSNSIHYECNSLNKYYNNISEDVNETIKQYHISIHNQQNRIEQQDRHEKQLDRKKKSQLLWMQQKNISKLITPYQLLELRLKCSHIKQKQSYIQIQGNKMSTIMNESGNKQIN